MLAATVARHQHNNMEELKEELRTVFISYSWDSEEHKNWVLNLADKLTKEGGVYVLLDRYDIRAGKPMTHFMEKAVNQSEKVLMIMTPNYKDKADNRIGGVGYEYSMITQEFYEKLDNEKFIPIRRNGNYDESAPKFLKSYVSHDMTNDLTFEKDFTDLLRIIYDEPEIVRPPLGKKPSFLSKTSSSTVTSLIDDKANLDACKMTTYAKWIIDIRINSLSDIDKTALFKQINSNIIIDKESKGFLPFILNNNYKSIHHPEIIYEIPLHTYIAFNHLMHEKLKIDDYLIHYEFSEYSNNDFCLLFISQPFSTLFYLLAILDKIHKQLNREIDISVSIKFHSDKRALLYGKHSPFNYPHIFNMQTMGIPESKADTTINLKEVSKDSMFDFFEKLYGLFVAENSKSLYPFVTLDRQHFDMVTNEFLN